MPEEKIKSQWSVAVHVLGMMFVYISSAAISLAIIWFAAKAAGLIE